MESLLRKSDGFIGYKIRARALPIANLPERIFNKPK
jgi:hypothetical protein